MRVRLVDDPRAEVGEDVRVGVRVGVVECQLYTRPVGRRCAFINLVRANHLITRRAARPPRSSEKERSHGDRARR